MMKLLPRLAPHALNLVGALLLGGLAYLGVTAAANASPPLHAYLAPAGSAAAGPVDAGTAPRSRAVVLMQLDDCLESRLLLQDWSDLHEEGRIPVVGILLDGPYNSARLDQVLETSGITFPVEQNGGRGLTRLARSLGYQSTPILMVADAAGRVRLASPLSEAPARALVRAMEASAGGAP